MKLAKIMLFCLFAVVATAIISCNQEQEDPALYGIHKYQKDIVLETPEGLTLDITVSGNDEAIIDAHTKDFFTIKPIYELPQGSLELNAVEIDPQFDGQQLEEDEEEVVVKINRRKLPLGAIGYTITEKEDLLRWDKIYAYDNECDCGQVQKLNTSGRTSVKLGVKTSSGQWFYNQILCAQLRSIFAIADGCYFPDYHVMRLRKKDRNNSISEYAFYALGGSSECE